MTDVIVVCEGQTEEAFVKRVLYPSLIPRNVFVQPRLIASSRRAKGGALNAQRVLRYLRNVLLERPDTYVTTFFDLYGLPADFPGRLATTTHGEPLAAAAEVEAGFSEAVVRHTGCRPERFIPYIQPYEFESLLFSDPTAFAEAEPEWQAFATNLVAARQAAASPEHINDGSDTHPSARLQTLRRPQYRKVTHGTMISERIGIHCMRSECRHFHQWLERLERLSPLPPEP